MTKDDIFLKFQEAILDILPNLNPQAIQPEVSLRDLGANSVDRADMLLQLMADLALKIPLVDLSVANNIGELVDIFHDKLAQQNNP